MLKYGLCHLSQKNVAHLLIRQLYWDLAAKSPLLMKISACHKLSGQVMKQKFHQVCHSHLGMMNHSKLYSIAKLRDMMAPPGGLRCIEGDREIHLFSCTDFKNQLDSLMQAMIFPL